MFKAARSRTQSWIKSFFVQSCKISGNSNSSVFRSIHASVASRQQRSISIRWVLVSYRPAYARRQILWPRSVRYSACRILPIGRRGNIAGGSMNPVRKRPIPRRRSPSGALGRINGFASVVSRNPIVAVVLPLRSRLPETPCWIVRSIARLPRLLHPDSSACGWG